jgi:hypothetical protein
MSRSVLPPTLAPTRHWPFGGSTCEQWLRCPGWYATTRKAETIVTKAMEDGTANHAICHEYAIGSRKAEDVPLWLLPLANAWKSVVDVRLGWRIEVPCELLKDTAGTTLDAVWYDELTDTLHVADLKTGDMPVQAFQNDQLLFGAVAYCVANDIGPSAFQLTIVHYDEVEGAKVRQWAPTVGEVDLFQQESFDSIQSNKVNMTSTLDNTLPGDHCGFCKGRDVCRSHHKKLAEVIAVATPVGMSLRDLPDVKDVAGALTPAQMAQVLDAKSYVTKLFTAIEKRALACGGVPGWSVGATKPHDQWKLPVKDTIAALEELGIDAVDVITPAAARKALAKVHGKAVASAAVSRLSEKPEGTPKLVSDSGSED